MTGALHLAMAVMFGLALSGAVGWIVPVLAIAALLAWDLEQHW